jgi:enoyl-CoA hydratase/carnithine racemase
MIAAYRHRQDPQERVARQGKGTRMNIQISREGPVAVVTLNRPERRNALSLELMLDLIAALEEIGRDREIRAVILAAAGKVFCSGHDLAQMAGRDINEYRRIFDVCTRLMQTLQGIPQPVIAEVQGIATAASSLVVAIGKQAFYTQIDLDQPKAYAYAKEVMSMNALAADAQGGIGAFLGKRTPCWSGK